MRHWVLIYIALGAVITSDVSDEALGAKLVCWLDPRILPSPSPSLCRINRDN
ncbi:hypothetical protein F383_04040 [Gossypium arboreum]|uniref:Uncharacterized protein n=1 Tax=Gossypium arboreum TaxID=29729 RepID=A0A0B0Q0S2_GOSAR|nr:hypothetical protein F383_04040 [Gossypium arboreum]